MRTVGVVGIDVDLEHVFEVAATTDEDPVEAFSADSATKRSAYVLALGASTGVRITPQAFAAGDVVEGAAELRVAIAHQEPTSPELLVYRHEQIAGLLGDPGACWPGGAAGQVHSAGVELDEEQHIEPPQEDGLDGEEIGGVKPSGLGAEKLTPGQLAGPRCRSQSVTNRRPPQTANRISAPHTVWLFI